MVIRSFLIIFLAVLLFTSGTFNQTEAAVYTQITINAPESVTGLCEGERTQLYGINDAGVIAGYYSCAAGLSGTFLWQNGIFNPPGVTFTGQLPVLLPGGLESKFFKGSSILCPADHFGDPSNGAFGQLSNGSGDVLVNCEYNDNPTLAFELYNGVLIQVGSGEATDINNLGQVVSWSSSDGSSEHCDTSGFGGNVYSPGGLSAGSPNFSGAACSFPWAINDLGEIVGWYAFSPGQNPPNIVESGFVDLLVPEPKSLVIFATGLIFLLGFSRRFASSGKTRASS